MQLCIAAAFICREAHILELMEKLFRGGGGGGVGGGGPTLAGSSHTC